MTPIKWSDIKYDIYDTVLAIRRRWFRSALSSFGVAIGVASLIVMLSISEGALKKTTHQYHLLGLNTLRIQPAQHDDQKVSTTGLSEAEFISMSKQIPSDAAISAFKLEEDVKIYSHGRSAAAVAVYVSEEWASIEKLQPSEGRLLSPLDQKKGAAVCVVGNEIAAELAVSVYKTALSFTNKACTVVGILKRKEGGFVENEAIHFVDFNRAVILPILLSSKQGRFKLEKLSGLTVSLPIETSDQVLPLARKIKRSLEQRYKGMINYQVVTPLELLNREKENQQSFSLIMMSISLMTLLVGGIGIMNIMLTHISEQTREIGLRLAVGAAPKRIVMAFLLHALIISMLGCILGSGVGLLLVLVFGSLLDWPISLSMFALVVGPVFSLMTGLLFGLYPALRASQMDPIIMLKEY